MDVVYTWDSCERTMRVETLFPFYCSSQLEESQLSNPQPSLKSILPGL